MTLTYNGHDLTSLAICGGPEIKLFDYQPTIQERSMDGDMFIGKRVGAGEVSFKVAITGSAAERRAVLSTWAGWMNVDEPKQLVLPDTPNWYYLAVPNGAINPERHLDGEVFTQTFTLTEPAAYGVEKTVLLPSGGSVTFTVGGTYHTYLTMKVANNIFRASDTDMVWGISLDNNKHLRVSMSSNKLYVASMDFWNRIIRGTNIIPITLDSDWLQLEPGEHTLTMDKGTTSLSNMTFKYRERWL